MAWEGTYASGAETLDFYRTVKEGCPETVFHGTDVGHQYDSTGARYRDYLEERGLTDTEDYRLTLEAIEQGEAFAEQGSDAYRENRMAENFIREFEALGGESVMASMARPTPTRTPWRTPRAPSPPWPPS